MDYGNYAIKTINLFAFLSFFRNFAIKRWRNYSVSAKKERVSLFCPHLFVTLSPNMEENVKIPHPLVAIVPVVVLIGFLAVVITLFGSDSLSGGSQVALLMGTAGCM